MEAPVNFDNLRSITGGDPGMESMLFEAFLEAAHACLDSLRAALVAGEESLWRQQAHAFKGICLNLGAEILGDLCGRAQMDWRASPEEKKAMLQSIESEFARVRGAIDEASKALAL